MKHIKKKKFNSQPLPSLRSVLFIPSFHSHCSSTTSQTHVLKPGHFLLLPNMSLLSVFAPGLQREKLSLSAILIM